MGCANGWRLNLLSKQHTAHYVGTDASQTAIQDGMASYPHLALLRCKLSDTPLKDTFDLAIVNFVLHWVDRTKLTQSIAAIDQIINDNGYLILGDFLPDCNQQRLYHHYNKEPVYTYKQDYSKIFESLGTYKEIARVTFNHDNPLQTLALTPTNSSNRGFVAC